MAGGLETGWDKIIVARLSNCFSAAVVNCNQSMYILAYLGKKIISLSTGGTLQREGKLF